MRPLTSNEISKELAEYQTGVPENTEVQPDVPPQSILPKPGNAYFEAPIDYSGMMPQGDRRLGYEAAESGWGQSMFDRGDFNPDLDLEEQRAREQSGFSKVMAGIAKGGVTAATTAVNTTIGTIFGAGASLFELASQKEGEQKTAMDIVDAGVNNWLSEQLMKIQTKSEEWFPNYRTLEERSDQYQQEWQKHIFTPNFIGDSILKNFGFTVGAIAGGAAWAKGIGALMRSSLASNLMRGVTAAAEGDANANAALETALAAIKNGTATIEDVETITENIQRASRQINSMNARLQMYGSLLGAMGEGTTEGIMAKNEFTEQAIQQLDQQYNQKLAEIYRFAMPTEDGMRAVSDKVRALEEEYNRNREHIESEGQRLASTTYLLNLPVLTASNAIQFGKLFSGGWKTAKSVKGLKGGIDVMSREGTDYMAPKLVGGFTSELNVPVRSVLGSLKVAGSESFEEMAQGAISSGAQKVASNHLAGFTNDGFDEEAINTTRDWFSGMVEGGKEYLSDWKNWQEGALGALTGLFGIPGRFWKGEWNGGIAGEILQAKQDKKAADDAAEKLNNLVNSTEFQNRWHGYIRHLKYDSDMVKAVDKNDANAWHTASNKQLINDVLMFADMGRLEDLQNIVDAYGAISDKQAESLKDILVTDKKVASNISIKEVKERIADRAQEMQDAISLYKDTYDDIRAMVPADSTDDYVKELIFTRMHMKNLERRFNDVYDEILEGIKPKISISEREDEQSLYSLIESVGNRYKQIFGQDKDYVPDSRLVDDTNKVLEQLPKEVYWDKEYRNKAKDLEKLYKARQAYYNKYQTLKSDEGHKAFVQNAMTQQKLNQESEAAAKKQSVEGIDSIDQMHEAFAIAPDKMQFIESMREKGKTNDTAKEFVDAFDVYEEYRHDVLNTSGLRDANKPGTFNAVAEVMLNKIFAGAKSQEEVLKRLENATFNKDSILAEVNQLAANGAIDEEYANSVLADKYYQDAEKAIQDTAKKFADAWRSTEGTKDLKKENPQKPVKDDNAPAPATLVPVSVPVKDETKAEAKEEKTEEKEEKAEMPEPVEHNPADAVSEDSYHASEDTSIQERDSWVRDQKGSSKLGYYQQSIPEIAYLAIKKIRDLIRQKRNQLSPEEYQDVVNGIKDAPKEDFVTFDADGNPIGGTVEAEKRDDFAASFKYLKDKNTFDYVARELNTNDEVVFTILPDAPKWNGHDQIVVAKVTGTDENGNITDVQPLTLLHDVVNSAGTYMNLDSLYDEIYKDRERQGIPEGSIYVFRNADGKPYTSRIFDKRAGIIRTGDVNEDIKMKPSYDSNAPIMIVDGANRPVILRGKVDPSKIFMPNTYTWSPSKYGRVYYLAKNGNDTYTPILVDKVHLTKEILDNAKDGSFLASIADKIKAIDATLQNVTADNLDSKNHTLRNHLGELSKQYNLDGISFEYRIEDGAPVLAINKRNAENLDEIKLHEGESLMSVIDELNRPIRLSPDRYLKESKANINAIIDDGLLTSNVLEMRQAGVNFLFDPWNGDGFKRILGPDADTSVSTPEKVAPVDAEMEDDEVTVMETEEEDEIPNIEDIPQVSSKIPLPIELRPYDDLSKKAKETLQRKGISQKEWDDAKGNTNKRKDMLDCK